MDVKQLRNLERAQEQVPWHSRTVLKARGRHAYLVHRQDRRDQLREDGRVFIGLVGVGPRETDPWSDKKLESKTEKLLNAQVTKE